MTSAPHGREPAPQTAEDSEPQNGQGLEHDQGTAKESGPSETAAPNPASGTSTDSAAQAGESQGATTDTSGVDNLMEEGGPVEPQDVDDGDKSAAADAAGGAEDLSAQLRERTLDLQRLQAEYVNYKRRVDRDRDVVRQGAVNNVLVSLLPVLDDIDRAREHGELQGGFRAVADSLEKVTSSLGLVRFAAKGDEFDPNLHEALMHGQSSEVTTTQVDVVAQAGYKVGDRVVRAARVTVLAPAEPPAGEESE